MTNSDAQFVGTEPGDASDVNSDAEKVFAVGEAVESDSVVTDDVTMSTEHKQIAWEAYKQAWNKVSSMDTMTKLEIRTARERFNEWWDQNYE